MTVRKFKTILPKICGKDTSFDPDGWTKENMLWGHCAVVTLLAQSLFQGGILGVSLKGTKFAKMKFHFWNMFPDYKQKDFTRSQFDGEFPNGLEVELIAASLLLAGKTTLWRFKLLQERFEAEVKRK